MSAWEDFIVQFAPFIFVLVGVVIAYMLYKMISGDDLRVFLLLNAIIQFIISIAIQNGVSVIVAILSLLPVFLNRGGHDSGGGSPE